MFWVQTLSSLKRSTPFFHLSVHLHINHTATYCWKSQGCSGILCSAVIRAFHRSGNGLFVWEMQRKVPVKPVKKAQKQTRAKVNNEQPTVVFSSVTLLFARHPVLLNCNCGGPLKQTLANSCSFLFSLLYVHFRTNNLLDTNQQNNVN